MKIKIEILVKIFMKNIMKIIMENNHRYREGNFIEKWSGRSSLNY